MCKNFAIYFLLILDELERMNFITLNEPDGGENIGFTQNYLNYHFRRYAL